MSYLKKVPCVKKKDDGPCPICMSELSEASGYDEENTGVYKLTKCGHMLHTPCVKAYIENSSFSKVTTFVDMMLVFINYNSGTVYMNMIRLA